MAVLLPWHCLLLMEHVILNEREVQVLEAIVRNYILTALPTGSRFISKLKNFCLSPASIRNVMGDLEEKGFIIQPHTSAGRIPTDKGYRYYVDRVMESGKVPKQVKDCIKKTLIQIDRSDLNMIMEATSKALSKATDQLGIILSPRLSNGIFRHLHIYEIGPQRYLLNLTIDSGFVKTVVVELSTEVKQNKIETVCGIINERFCGMSLQEIFLKKSDMFSDIKKYDLGIIRLFIPSIQKMLSKNRYDEIFSEGKTNILLKPEFFNKEQISAIIEILEEKKLLMHMFEDENDLSGRVIVSIGGEIEEGKFSSFSIIKTSYRIGNMQGSLGIIGPKRMQYPFLISVVDYTSKVIEELYTS